MNERSRGRARLSTNEMHPTRDRPSSQPTRKASPKVSGGAQGGGSAWGARLATVRAVLGVQKGAREPSGVFARHQGDAGVPGASSAPLPLPRLPPQFDEPTSQTQSTYRTTFASTSSSATVSTVPAA